MFFTSQLNFHFPPTSLQARLVFEAGQLKAAILLSFPDTWAALHERRFDPAEADGLPPPPLRTSIMAPVGDDNDSFQERQTGPIPIVRYCLCVWLVLCLGPARICFTGHVLSLKP